MPTGHPDVDLLHAIRAAAATPAAMEGLLADLGALVAIRSGTGDADGVGRVADRLAGDLRALGAEVTTRADGPAGPTLVAVLRGAAPGPQLGAALSRLERRWVESGFTLGRDELLDQI